MVKNRIGSLRREEGLNQKELGDRLGVGQTTVSAWELGKNEPDSTALGKMAQVFHVSIGYLMGYEENTRTRGLSQDEYDMLVERNLARREDEKMEMLEHRADLTEEEIEEIIRDQDMSAWEVSSKADTLEGFLASQIIDQQPQKKRKWLLSILQQIANGPMG